MDLANVGLVAPYTRMKNFKEVEPMLRDSQWLNWISPTSKAVADFDINERVDHRFNRCVEIDVFVLCFHGQDQTVSGF